MLDSGAGVSVWPKKFGGEGKASLKKSRAKLEAANSIKIQQDGSRRMPLRADTVRRGCEMELLVAGIALRPADDDLEQRRVLHREQSGEESHRSKDT